ncbi:MAG: hypothetical protein F9K16_02940 [Thermoanaerobaculia bacterium]|nr:MAG: hypothetical protein F9K16_02940 [Thermoanaerobaculia bacterium]MBZ0102128.1 hypothetical protein [Thermoanaerobaculia bacterium]
METSVSVDRAGGTGIVEHERVTGRLLVKAQPLADGSFAPYALWLNRAYPATGGVVRREATNSHAPFECLVGNGDTSCYSALASKTRLRRAFHDRRHAEYQAAGVAR